MIEKTILRKKMKGIRDSLSPGYRKEAACFCHQKILKSSFYKEAVWVYTYISTGSELDTRELINAMLKDGKRVAVPKIHKPKMNFYEIRSLSECEPGTLGILEPVDDLLPVTTPGLMLIPGLAFTDDGSRLGYGGGYYDRYLTDHPGHICCGLAYKDQILSFIPTDDHDQKLDYIITGS